MNSRANFLAAATALLTPLVAGQAQNCPQTGVCYAVGVPEVVASSGSGNVYFQITAPTSYSWVGMGTGSRMSGSSMFIIYQDGNGNVTVSPRSSSGHSEPSHDSSIKVELLEGSGVSGGSMIANFRTSDLGVDVTSSNSPWLAAWLSGSSLDSSSASASISRHSSYTTWAFDLSKATVANDANPYAGGGGSTSGGGGTSGNGDSGTGSGTGTGTGSGGGSGGNSGVVGGSEGSGAGSTRTVLYIHALVASIAFVVLMPFASVLMPLLGKWYIHAGLQLFSFIMMWIGFGLGVKLANDSGIIFKQAHTILGTVVICAMVLQPIFGWLHHLHYVKHQGRGAISYLHIWYGRVLMTLGIINGGLGLELAHAESGYKIAYGAVAAIMVVVYAVGKIAGNMRKSQNYKQAPAREAFEPRRRPYTSEDDAAWSRQHSETQHMPQHMQPQPYEGHYEGARYDSNRYA